jgi:FkbM family methyltransferase
VLREVAIRGVEALGLRQVARKVRAVAAPTQQRRLSRDVDHFTLLIRLALRRDAGFVDVGATDGSVLDVVVATAPEGGHVAFEPTPSLARDLRERFPRVDVHEAAVSDREGRAEFAIFPEHPGFSGLASSLPAQADRTAADMITVPTVRLDDVLSRPPSLVKIDVDGQLAVLRGARRVLADARPIVGFALRLDGASADDEYCEAVFAELDGARLRISDLDGRQLPWPAFHETCRSGSHWNFVAHP